jgi:hypothetical protein
VRRIVAFSGFLPKTEFQEGLVCIARLGIKAVAAAAGTPATGSQPSDFAQASLAATANAFSVLSNHARPDMIVLPRIFLFRSAETLGQKSTQEE